MRLKLGAAAAAVLLALPASSGLALAFDHGRDCNCDRGSRATYASVARPVMVRPGYRQVLTSPAIYGTLVDRVLVAPGRMHTEHSPAIYAHHTDRVLVSPQRVVYQPRVIPAVYRDVARKVVVRPAFVRYVNEPAVYRDVARRVVAQPASSRVIEHPAVMGVRHERVLVGYSTGGGTRFGHGWGRSEVPLWGYGAPRHHHGNWHHR